MQLGQGSSRGRGASSRVRRVRMLATRLVPPGLLLVLLFLNLMRLGLVFDSPCKDVRSQRVRMLLWVPSYALRLLGGNALCANANRAHASPCAPMRAHAR
jgi:hypothetical protein